MPERWPPAAGAPQANRRRWAIEALIDVILLSFLVLTALAFVVVRNLFAVVMLSGIFSLTAAVLYVVMDAVDVAFTEAAVGAGIATVLGLATLALIRVPQEKPSTRSHIGPFLVALITGAVLISSTFDMPSYGDPNAPIHRHVAPRYIEESGREIGVPNIVTSVLASYRGYDTLGEVTVIFTAASGVLVLLGRARRRQPVANDSADAERKEAAE
jgi:multicomponent Na+:H+ antiporter subunit B